jgi:hypothetical protein
MKLYRFTAFSKESEDFEMQIVAHENILFSEMHQAIQVALEYDPLQMASFFLSNDDWDKEQEIALISMDEKSEILLMDETKLGDKIDQEGQKIIYLYDFFSERSFYIHVDAIDESNTKDFSINVKGEIPIQINIDSEGIDSLMNDIGAKDMASQDYEDDFGSEFGGSDSYENIDDLENY